MAFQQQAPNNVGSNEDLGKLQWFDHSSAKRINTDAVMVEALRTQYPNLDLIVVPPISYPPINLLAYASAGFATLTPLEDDVHDPVYGPGLKWRFFIPPARRLDSWGGAMVDQVLIGKYMYKYRDHEFILYVANGRDGSEAWPSMTNHYILTSAPHKVDELIKNCTIWTSELHNEIWVFDSGYWQKNGALYASIENASWDNVILDEDMKKALIADVDNFFDSRDTYQKLKVPWKRGIIYYGPPGNGKTISIKAMMHSLYQRGVNGDSRTAVPTLYVRSLSSFAGPEYSIKQIFALARQEAPCYLVFEDLDSIVSDNVRSYFLNEVDGLQSNDGILMVGSTNHLDRLDPGISKRPSRFDRKYFFANPNFDERVQYAKFWQHKLASNKDLDFPNKLCGKVAEITDKFSFAYIQEAFVASLLAIAARGGKDINDTERNAERWAGPEDPMTAANHEAFVERVEYGGSEPDLEHLELWIELQKQVKILREELEKGGDGESISSADPWEASFNKLALERGPAKVSAPAPASAAAPQSQQGGPQVGFYPRREMQPPSIPGLSVQGHAIPERYQPPQRF